jgi:hypothetical protein
MYDSIDQNSVPSAYQSILTLRANNIVEKRLEAEMQEARPCTTRAYYLAGQTLLIYQSLRKRYEDIV